MEDPTNLLSLVDFSVSGLLAGLIFGIVGMWMFRQGKRKSSLAIVGIAVALMLYPYFTRGPIADWGVGLALCGAAYYIW